MQDLSIGTQTFKQLREETRIYVDKTRYAYEVLTKPNAYFLSRPRRFGKSLFLSTLMELAEGNRALFNGTWVDDNWDWNVKYPVIHLKFASMPYQGLGLEEAIRLRILDKYKEENILPHTTDLKELFYNLVVELHKTQNKVVILIDEYDKPILDAIEKENSVLSEERRETMKTFYSVLKDCEPYLQCTFVTGITKFAKVSIFSDLNHLNDLTFDIDFATAFGYTQEELETNFSDYLQDLVQNKTGLTYEILLAEIKEWYNGYSWDGVTSVYNPYGLVHFFAKKRFGDYWFESGTPSILTKRVLNQRTFAVENLTMNISDLNFHTIDGISNVALLFQATPILQKKRLSTSNPSSKT